MNRGLFITGTDTGVGKTVITAALIKSLHAGGMSVAGMKPIETGCAKVGNSLYPADGMFLKKAALMEESMPYITPYCFESPVAPSMAAEMEGHAVSIGVIMERFYTLLKKYQSVVVEGIGGLMVPIKKDYFVLDLVRDMDIPLVVVTRPSLGTINHTLLTVNYALKERISVAGIIVNFSRPSDGTVAENTSPMVLQQICPVPVLGVFPHLRSLEDEVIERAAIKHLDLAQIQSQLEKSQG